MVQNASQAVTNTTFYIRLIEVLLPIIGGSLATMLGVIIQRYLNEHDEDILRLYSPLHQRLNDLRDGEIRFTDNGLEIESIWDSVDEHRKYNLAEETRNEIELLSENLDDLEAYFRHLRDGIANECTYNNVLMGSSGSYPAIAYENRGGTTISFSLDYWIKIYYGPVLRANSSDELEQYLRTHAEEKGEVYLNIFDEWDSNDFEQMFSAIETAEQRLRDNSEYESINECYSSVKRSSESLSERFRVIIGKRGILGYLTLRISSFL